jgi:hypothetical protein
MTNPGIDAISVRPSPRVRAGAAAGFLLVHVAAAVGVFVVAC